MKGKERPASEPAVFSNLPASVVPTPQAKVRDSEKLTALHRSRQDDEYQVYQEHDELRLEDVCGQVTELGDDITAFPTEGSVIVQSTNFVCGMPKFVIRIGKDASYQAYHAGVQCRIATLTKNRIVLLDKWSRLEEAIRYLRNRELDRKEEVVLESVECMGAGSVGTKLYSVETICRAIEYYATSRCLYERLRSDYQLPSVRVLRDITSAASKLEDGEYIKAVFAELDERQKQCIILIDEVYVKPSLMYHVGTVFGRTENRPDMLAKTVLLFMVKCLFGGPQFVAKALPVHGLDAAFQFREANVIIGSIRSCSGVPVAIVTDNNRTNQMFFKMFEHAPDRPWLSVDEKMFFSIRLRTLNQVCL